MANLRTLAIFGLALGAAACGASDVRMTQFESDTERSGDPVEVEEAELRSNATYDAQFAEAAAEFNVPAALLKAVAFAQTRFEMVSGEQEFEGQPTTYGLMGIGNTQVETAAAKAQVTVEAAKTDVTANIRAAAALLSAYADEAQVDRSDIKNFAGAVVRYSAIENPEAAAEFVREGVFGTLIQGVGALSEELASSGQSLELEGEFGSTTQELLAGPDFAGAVWRPSINFNSRPSKPSMVVIHTCESGYSGCWSWLTQFRARVSAHYVVSEDGKQISQLVRETNRAWHVGASYNCRNNGGVSCSLNGSSVNNFSIGIEHGGRAAQQRWSSGLLDASARLACNISRDRGIPRDRYHFVGHGKVQPYDRRDPGPNWPWSDYLARINRHCGAAPAPKPAPSPTPQPTQPPPPTATPTTGEIVIDSNNDRNNRARGYVQVSANWKGTASTSGFYGTGYYFSSTRAVSDGATFFFYLPAAATKTIDAWWTAGANRASEAPFIAVNAVGTKVGTATANQRINGGKWNTVGRFAFSKGWNKVVLSRWTSSGEVVIADAVRVR